MNGKDYECTDFVIDLETEGLAPNAFTPIIQMSVVGFNRYKPFEDQLVLFDKVIKDTIGTFGDLRTVHEFWLEHHPDYYRYLKDYHNKLNIEDALLLLEDFFNATAKDKDFKVWGNGAIFDLGLLNAKYANTDRAPPYSYKNEMCFRTIKAVTANSDKDFERAKKFTNAFASKLPEETNWFPHNSLWDSMCEAKQLHIMLQRGI
jgi:hypothetical protein